MTTDYVQDSLFPDLKDAPPDPQVAEAERVLSAARDAEAAAEARIGAAPLLDSAAWSKEIKRLKRQLALAASSGQLHLVVLACRDAVAYFTATTWPDNWTHWQITLDDHLDWRGSLDLRYLLADARNAQAAA